MKDFIGQDVNVGDTIYYSTTGRRAESRLCEVTRFTAKSIFVIIKESNRPGMTSDKEVVVRNDFIKVGDTRQACQDFAARVKNTWEVQGLGAMNQLLTDTAEGHVV